MATMSDETPGAPTDDRAAVGAAWRQVGVYMENAQATWDRLAKRNFGFWKEVATSLQNGPVDADKLAGNTARAMSVALQTMDDLWMTMVEPPRREVYVQVLPTAFLFFDKVTDPQGGHHYTGQDPVHIPVNAQRENLPDEALITISGNPTDPKADPAAAIEALTEQLTTRRVPGARSYLLETVVPANIEKLVAGTYDGLIYLTKPTLPLANLRVVVEGPPPVVDERT
jgi:hypothetical protein